MPTYTVTHSSLPLSPEQKDRLAAAITTAHHEATGANRYFAQVIFAGQAAGNHFIGGQLASEPQLFLNGQIRAGRTAEVKKKLIRSLRDALAEYAELARANIWVYITELPPEQMLEYGEVLPQSGQEDAWYAGLSPELREKLSRLDG